MLNGFAGSIDELGINDLGEDLFRHLFFARLHRKLAEGQWNRSAQRRDTALKICFLFIIFPQAVPCRARFSHAKIPLPNIGRQRRSAGLVLPAAQRGLGPARLDGQAPEATAAGKKR